MKIFNINHENEERAIQWVETACRIMGVDLPDIERSAPTCVVFEWKGLPKDHVLAGTVIWINMNRHGVNPVIGSEGLWSTWMDHHPFVSARWAVVDMIVDHKELLRRQRI